MRGGWNAAQGYLASAQHPLSAKLFMGFTNLTMLFQDVTMFIGDKDGVLYFAKKIRGFFAADVCLSLAAAGVVARS